MENDPIKCMYDEHDFITKAEEIIKNCDQLWETDIPRYTEVITTLVEFLRDYADGYHHRKEEEVLFPAIKDHPDFVLEGLIDEFVQHHEDFRDYTSEIQDAVNEGDYVKSYKELNRYLQDLLDHMGAENDELFSLAETLLDEEQLENIFFKFKDIDMELGEDRKAELEQKIDRLAESF